MRQILLVKSYLIYKIARDSNICYNRRRYAHSYISSIFFEKESFMLESRFQANLIKELKSMFVGCFVLKNDANYIQGFPDLLILYNNKWAALECKRDAFEDHQPNQEYYITELDKMSFARTIYPENKEEVLYELQQTFGSRRTSRLSRR